MNWIDLIIIAIVAFFTVKSSIRGLISEICSVIAIIAGFFIASSHYIELGDKLHTLITNSGVRYLLSFIAIFILVYFGFILLGFAGKKIMKISLLGWFDHLAGGILGLAKGVFVVSVLAILITSFLPKKAALIKESKTYKYFKRPTELILALSPYTLRSSFEKKQKPWPLPLKSAARN